MKITTVLQRDDALIERLVQVWEGSVRQTHLFLSEEEILQIKSFVPQALREVPCLITAENPQGIPVAFMGIDGQKLEMLFVAKEERGNGIGKQLICYAIEQKSVNEVAVNEQNPLAKGFYEHMGFTVERRSELDEQGNPYPILYMKR